MKPSRLLVRLVRPLGLLTLILMYGFGISVAKFLGNPIQIDNLLTGMIWAFVLFLCFNFMQLFFGQFTESDSDLILTTKPEGEAESRRYIWLTLLIGLSACFVVLTYLTFLIMHQIRPHTETFVVMALGVISVLLYHIPVFRIVESGYGELILSILIVILIPAFAFSLQTGELSRLLTMSVVPLSLLYLAAQIAFELSKYARYLHLGLQNLTTRMGWQNAMAIHNLLILSAFALFLVSAYLGMPKYVMYALLLTFPLALLQIWQFQKISSGVKPNWTGVRLAAMSLFGISAFLITFTYLIL